MKPSYQISAAAKTDLLKIWSYLAEMASFDVADKVAADLRAGMQKLAKLPGLGHERGDLTALPVKFYRIHKYLIVYKAQPGSIDIVRVLHSARDISAILGGT